MSRASRSTTLDGARRRADRRPDVRRADRERLHLLPPFRWRLAEVPLGLDHPVLDRGPGLRRRVPRARAGAAQARRRPPARRAGRAHPRARRWTARTRCGSCTSSRGCARAASRVFTKIHHAAIDGMSGRRDPGRAARPVARGARGPAAPTAAAAPAARRASSRCSQRGLARHPAPAAARAGARCRATLAHLDAIPGVQDIPGAPTLARGSRAASGARPRARATAAMLEAPRAKAPRTASTGRSPRTAGSRSGRCR